MSHVTADVSPILMENIHLSLTYGCAWGHRAEKGTCGGLCVCMIPVTLNPTPYFSISSDQISRVFFSLISICPCPPLCTPSSHCPLALNLPLSRSLAFCVLWPPDTFSDPPVLADSTRFTWQRNSVIQPYWWQINQCYLFFPCLCFHRFLSVTLVFVKKNLGQLNCLTSPKEQTEMQAEDSGKDRTHVI